MLVTLLVHGIALAQQVAPAGEAKPAADGAAPAAQAVCTGYTLTQGAYGSGNGAGARALQNFTGSVTIGCTGGYTLTLTSVAAIVNFLPSGSTGRALDQSYTDPGGSYSNVLAGQLVTTTLNARFSNIGDQILVSGPYAGSTVNQVIAMANSAIGGCSSGADFSALTGALDMINQNYDEGANLGNLTCCDRVAPVFSSVSDKTINCGDALTFDRPTATDAQDGAVAVTQSGQDVTTAGACPGNYSVTRTWSAIDRCGNTSTTSQTITVQDVTAPAISELPAATTINCPATPVFAQATATDSCDGNVQLSYVDVTTAGSCAGNYSVTRTWTATDACGNSSTASQTINVQDVTPPVIAELPGVTTIDCPATPAFAQATATDGCDANVSLTYVDVTTAGSCAGNYSVTRTWTATDACGNSSTASQTINVQDITAPVIAALPATSTINCPATPSFAQATATDGCDANLSLSYVDVTTPGSCAGNYSVTRTWTAKDACGNSSTASQTINVQDVTAPVFAALPGPSTINCPATPSFAQASATDACGTVTLTSSVTTTYDCIGGYTSVKTWTATDACGNKSTASQSIKVISCQRVTVTQGGWGANCSGGNWGCYLDKNFASNFPNGLIVGNTSNNKYVLLTSASAVHGFLPSGGTPAALTKAWTNPTKKTLSNTLAGQAVALTLNLKFWNSMSNMVVASGSFAGKSVQEMLNIANAVLGGSTAYSASAVNDVLNSINMNYDNGTVDLGFLTCPNTNSGAREGFVGSHDNNPTNDFVTVTAYPNPFVDRIKIDFTVEETSHVNLQLYNASGASVHTLYDGVAEKGVQYSTEYSSTMPGMYIYRMSTAHGVTSGKVIQIK